MIAGPNGSGKSSTVGARLGRYLPIVNPDDIARDATDGNPVAAGRVALAERRALLSQGASFAIETTLSGAGVLRFMAAAREAGFRIMLIYIAVAAPELSRFRVLARARDGGHDVPERDVFRRYSASLENLGVALEVADRAWVLDNTGRARRLLLSRDRERLRFLSSNLPAWAVDSVPPRFRSPG